MRKKLVFIVVLLVFLCGLSLAIFVKREEAHQARLCEIFEFISQEEKLVQRHIHRESADVFFWQYYGEKLAQQTLQSLQQLRSNSGPAECLAFQENDFSWLISVSPEDQRNYLSIQKESVKIREEFRKSLAEFKNKKEVAFLELQEDLKKYRFHVQQLRRGDVPKQILERACRAPASVLNAKKQKSCKKALILTKEFRVKDESNLGHNRRILLQKWLDFQSWVESAISEIEQGDSTESALGEGE